MKLIAFSGKKQSGKDSMATFLYNNKDLFFPSSPSNPVHLPKEFGGMEVFFMKTDTRMDRMYFGEPMKTFCRDYLGVPHEWLYGTNEDKNKLTHIRWEDLPHYRQMVNDIGVRNMEKLTSKSTEPFEGAPFGLMTVRELLQQVGEEMFLKMDPDIWIRQFEQKYFQLVTSDTDVAVVADPRKPEQIDMVHKLGGIVIRLLRAPFELDRHISETALDPEVYDQSNFDQIIDNKTTDLNHTQHMVLLALQELDYIRKEIDLNAVKWG